MSSAYDSKVTSPVLSPSLDEFSEAKILDESNRSIDILAVVQTDVNGNSNLGSAAASAAGHVSQVTANKQSPVVACPGGEKIRLISLVSLDTNGNPVPFALKAKFQSAVQTGTGSSQNIPHGLGVVPSLVLVAPQSNGAGSGAWTVVEGVHDATNLKVTATSGIAYKVICLA
jgi:hypothetical protein